MIAKTKVYNVEIIRRKMEGLVSLISYTEFKPFMMAKKPFPADHSVVIAVMEIRVVEVAVSYMSVIIETIMELTAVGKISVKKSSMLLSCILKNGTILKRSMINGKKEMMIKKAACAENAPIKSSPIFFINSPTNL
jgi:hypothetical protein